MQTPFSAPGRSGPAATSNVKLPTPGGPVTQNWQSIVQLAAGLAGQSSGLAALQSQVSNLKLVSRALDSLHPFKLYQLPDVLRITPDPDTDWRKFIVRAGRVLGADATGTDAVNADPDSETYPTSPTEITVPEDTAAFWFWIEINGSTPTVRYGPTPSASSYSSDWTSTNPWTAAPVPDSQHIPIGWVDTHTEAASHNAIVRQLLRQDIISVGSGTSGAIQECTITHLYNADYFGATPVAGGSEIKVAKSLPSRLSFGPNTYSALADNSRTSDDGTGATAVNPEDQVMDPLFVVGQPVWVAATDKTGITVGGTELTHIEHNTRRGWAHPAGFTQISGVWVLTP